MLRGPPRGHRERPKRTRTLGLGEALDQRSGDILTPFDECAGVRRRGEYGRITKAPAKLFKKRYGPVSKALRESK